MSVLSRRRFLKISAGGVGLAAGGAIAPRLATLAAEPGDPNEIRKIPTFCDICFWKCGAVAYVKGGRLWKIEGHPEDPLSAGRLCPRGTGGIGMHTDPDRLRSPLMRKGSRGNEEWVAVTWDEALGHIAEKMQAIKSKYGAESMAMFSHGLGGKFFKHTLRAFGTPNLAAACTG